MVDPSHKPANAVDHFATWTSTFLGCGFFPIAPATFASAVAAVVLYFVYPLPALWTGVACVVVLFLGVWSSGRIERFYGHDPSAAVIDEVLGMMLTLWAAPMTPTVILVGFLAFRVFDILKIWPGRLLERLPGGWGIMLDDAMAGVYGWIIVQLMLWWWPDPVLTPLHLGLLGAAGVVLFAFRKPLIRRYAKKRSKPSAVFGRRPSP